ncbi:EpsG family protein [Parabacteroides sp.]|uniref:EpsG family protein n=1 Tax=Parabacteroides sp. TaxID=1869337 RepID=UPI00257D6A6C|nr:EpsG family protein [Parabacteroides sp.]
MGLFVVMLVVAAGFRDGLHGYRDYENYVSYFLHGIEETEISFQIICGIFRLIDPNDYLPVFVTYALLGVGFKYFGIRDLTKLTAFSLAIYVSYFYSLHELTQMRAGVASGIGLVSFRYIYDRKLLPFLILIAAAASFHVSALLYLPLYLLDSGKIRWSYWIGGGLFIWLFGQLLETELLKFFFNYVPIEMAQNKLLDYGDKGAKGIGLVLFSSNMAIFSYLQLGLFILFSGQLRQYNKYYYLLLKIYMVGFAVRFMFSSVVPELGNRGSEMCMVVSIILIPMLAYCVKPRLVGVLAVFWVGMANLYYMLYSWDIIP